MASKIKKSEWIALAIFTGIIDLAQIAIDLFLTEFVAAPEVINEFVDVGMGVGLVMYFQVRGVSVLGHMGRFASMLGMEFLTDITGGAASLWILEVWYMYKTVRAEEAENQIAEEQERVLRVEAVRQPAYQEVDGEMVRMPEQTRNQNAGPKNRLDGVRPPEMRLSKPKSDTFGQTLPSPEQSFSA